MNLKTLILFGHGSKVPGFEEVMNYHKKRIEDIGIFDQIKILFHHKQCYSRDGI